MINNDIFKHKLIDKKITIKQLSKNINLSVNTISKWINGNNLAQIDKFLDMVIYLDIDINELKK